MGCGASSELPIVPFTQTIAGPILSRDGPGPDGVALTQGKVKLLYFGSLQGSKQFSTNLEYFSSLVRTRPTCVFEIVLVSWDEDQAAFDEHLKMGSWFAVPFDDQARRTALNQMFMVQQVPALIILDERDSIISNDGVNLMANDPQGAGFPWRPRVQEEEEGGLGGLGGLLE